MRTPPGPVHDRSVAWMRGLWTAAPVLVVIIAIETWIVRPGLVGEFFTRPLAWLFAIVTLVGAALVFTGIRAGQERRTFTGSGTVVVGMLAAGAATIYPTILLSTLNPEHSLTAMNTAASQSSSNWPRCGWPVAALFTVAYFWYIARSFSGKISTPRPGDGPY